MHTSQILIPMQQPILTMQALDSTHYLIVQGDGHACLYDCQRNKIESKVYREILQDVLYSYQIEQLILLQCKMATFVLLDRQLQILGEWSLQCFGFCKFDVIAPHHLLYLDEDANQFIMQ